MDIMQLLQLEGFDFKKEVKLIRHTKEGGVEIEQIYKSGLLLDYQSAQTKNIFDNCSYIVSFLGAKGTKAKFVGIYEVINKTTVGEMRKIKEIPELGIVDFYKDSQYYYEQRLTTILAEYIDRLVIDWGNSVRNWCQNISNKEVVEILPKGYQDNFPGFNEVVISYDELRKVIDYKDANREWHKMLSSVAGVYLILDTVIGMQYIGSAYGKEGIIGRWKQYAKDGHGGNKQLKELLEKEPERLKKFQYSILRTLPQSMTKNEVIEIEMLYKKKLGSRAFGLNSN